MAGECPRARQCHGTCAGAQSWSTNCFAPSPARDHCRCSSACGDSAALPLDSVNWPRAVAEFEKAPIARTLSETGGNETKTAYVLEISEHILWYKVKKYRLV